MQHANEASATRTALPRREREEARDMHESYPSNETVALRGR